MIQVKMSMSVDQYHEIERILTKEVANLTVVAEEKPYMANQIALGEAEKLLRYWKG